MYKPCHIDARRTSALCLQNNQTTFSLTARVCVRTGRTWTRAREHASSWCAAALHYASELQSTRLYSTTSSGFCAGGRAHVPVCAPHVIDRMRDVIAFSIVSKGSKNMQSHCERNQLNNIEALQIARVSHIHQTASIRVDTAVVELSETIRSDAPAASLPTASSATLPPLPLRAEQPDCISVSEIMYLCYLSALMFTQMNRRFARTLHIN